MRRTYRLATVFFLLVFPLISHARLIQIIHTNDLHSYFKGYYSGAGGYARVRSMVKKLRAEAESKGIEVIHLDAGDWGEGTSFYHANKGIDSLKALELLGVDVATIGNHDHMMGGDVLGQQIREANIRTKFTAANISPTPRMKLSGIITPYVDLKKNDISIRIIGLTTDEMFFQYTMYPGKILNPIRVARKQEKAAKRAKKELVIALSHLGIKKDIKLARGTSHIDLIIGGHSHSKLDDIYWEWNRKGKPVPIVQAWAHGLGVGSIFLDVDKRGNVNVVDYKLHEIDDTIIPDPEMEEFVERVVETRNNSFPFDWNEIIGESKTPLTGYISGHAVYRTSCWGWHLATAAREAVGATVGIHVANFEGVYKPPGPVTIGDIADQFPHFRKFGDQGWEIATVRLPGWLLRSMMYIVSRMDVGVTFSGLGYNKGLPLIQDKAMYTLAFPAEVAYAIKVTLRRYRTYLKDLRYTGKYYWPVMTEYVKRNSPLTCH